MLEIKFKFTSRYFFGQMHPYPFLKHIELSFFVFFCFCFVFFCFYQMLTPHKLQNQGKIKDQFSSCPSQKGHGSILALTSQSTLHKCLQISL